MRSLAGLVWSAAAASGAPALRVMLRRRVGRGREIASRLGERFGVEASPRPEGRVIWLHAASVGETLSVLPLLPLLPGEVTILFTTGTVTSARLLASRLGEAGAPARVLHRFVPLDVPRWVAAFLEHWRPDAACFVESELWPNMLWACRRRGIPVGLVNARLSERSAARWARAGGLAREMLGGFRWVTAQTGADAARLAALGAPEAAFVGDLKLAAPPLPADPGELSRLTALLDGRPVLVAASTHPGDEEMAASVHQGLLGDFPGLLTILVPRHPARGPGISTILGGAALRSAGQNPPLGAGIWVADTLGELGLFYRLAWAVFLGKSFGRGGGQNPWEPARLGCAVATGPATANFTEAVELLSTAGGLEIVADAAALTRWVADMLGDRDARVAQGERARAAATASGDMVPRVAALVSGLLT